MLKTTLLFIVTALAEIVGCFLPYLWLRKGGVNLVIGARHSESRFIRLAINVTPGGQRTCLRGLRWRLRSDRSDLVAYCRWHYSIAI